MRQNILVIESDMVLLLPDQGLAQPVMASQMSHQNLWDSCVRHGMASLLDVLFVDPGPPHGALRARPGLKSADRVS